ncbi:MAG TPA: response regulator transcription factor [Bellilinea sp.]|jgi:two-component system response regulator VicR|nr:response regulator transcription factor [Bellilinea sp.]
MKPKIIIIDDDDTLSELVRVNLQPRGYEVISSSNSADAVSLTNQHNPDLIILDVMMPGMDGFEVCQNLRKVTEVPILFLTAKGREQDLVHGFEVGGDDYVRKPFSIRELEARVSALLKRAAKSKNNGAVSQSFNDGIIRIDLDTHHVYRNNKMVHLTPTEYRLLSCLVRNIGAVVTHEDLLREAWGENYIDATASLSLYVRYLREKIEEDPGNPVYIMTKWGVGYWFANPNKPDEH